MQNSAFWRWLAPLPLLAACAAPGNSPDALAQQLNASILASSSATLALEKWCADHAMAAEPKIVARLVRGSDKPASADTLARLGAASQADIRYRRVQLYCGAHLFSEADNWYVPARLTPAMNRLLQETDTPFGKVVQPLAPYRRTHSTRMLHSPTALFEHSAVLYSAAHQPIAEVRETYQRGALAFL
jgi:chorismate-pyruvate lyase